MNKLLLNILIAVAISSCSQQKYSFRKTIPVKASEQMAVGKANKPQKAFIAETDRKLPEAVLPEKALTVDLETVSQPQENTAITASSERVNKDFANPQEWKAEEKTPEKTIPHTIKKITGDSSGLAIAGFILALAGIFIAAVPFGILAVIFGIIALKSSRKGLAIAAIVIGMIDVILGLIYISRMAGQ